MNFTISTIFLCIVFLLLSIRRIINNRYSYLHVCSIIFFVIQVVSLFANLYVNTTEIRMSKYYIGVAMNSNTVTYIYDIFCVVTMIVLYYVGNMYSKYRVTINFSALNRSNDTLSKLLVIPMFLPILGVYLSPNPDIYSFFSYFYTHDVDDYSIDRIYHNTVLSNLNMVSFVSIIICYLLKKKKTSLDILISIAIIMITWIDGKRTLLTFSLISILTIDFIKYNSKNKNNIMWKKIILFGFILVGYFTIYGMLTKKGEDLSSRDLYNSYFTRENEVKLSIYSRTEGNRMLSYDGQSLLFNLTYYIPRTYWKEKPYTFYNYITSYSFYGRGDTFVSGTNLQVNIWSEFIANYGIIGYFMALLFILWVIKNTERTNNPFVNLFGTVFVFIYFVFGFEKLCQIIFPIWLFLFIKKRWS